LRESPTLGFGDDGVHFGHDLIVRNIRAWVVEAGLNLGLEPCRIADFLLLGLELRNEWG